MNNKEQAKTIVDKWWISPEYKFQYGNMVKGVAKALNEAEKLGMLRAAEIAAKYNNSFTAKEIRDAAKGLDK